jgi:hypothetical protein
MSYKPLIIKSDFEAFVKLGKNIKDSDLDLHIRDAQDVDFFSWANDTFYSDLINNLSTKPQLTELFNTYIKPYLIFTAYYKFMLWHGANVSQFGTRQNQEDTSQEISDKRRGELLGDIQSKINIYLSRLKDKLKDDDYTYDSVVYDWFNDCDKVQMKPQLNIRQLGQRSNYPKHNLRRYGNS